MPGGPLKRQRQDRQSVDPASPMWGGRILSLVGARGDKAGGDTPDRGNLRTTFGFPFAPPPLLTSAIVRARLGLGRVQREAAPPSVRVLEGLFGLFDNRVLGLLVELDLPDLLHGPRSTAELAVATGTSADALGRVLRYAAGRGLVECDRQGRWRATPVTEVLRRDHPNSWRAWVEVAGSDWFWDAWRNADVPLRGEASAVEAATGVHFFEFLGHVRPDAGDAFNRAMAAVSTVQALALSEALNWSGIRTVCDVGGGTGAALEYLLTTQADLDGLLFDLPEVVSHARPGLTSPPLVDRCRLEGGDFFEHVPAGADLYLLLAIIHDWDEARATRILLACVTPLGRPLVPLSSRAS
jgi:hypothetical protein